MNWFPILALAAATFAVAVFGLRLPRRGWTLLGATLMFGLTGYAVQGSPGLPAAPAAASAGTAAQSGAAMVEARRSLFDTGQPKPGYLTVSDGFARKGRFAEAAGLLRQAVKDHPGDGEAWLALANALVEHAGGQVTPAAIHAFGKAEEVLPGNPGPAYFLGFALLRSGKPEETRQVWAELLAGSPADAPWRADLTQRIELLDRMMAQIRRAQAMP